MQQQSCMLIGGSSVLVYSGVCVKGMLSLTAEARSVSDTQLTSGAQTLPAFPAAVTATQ